MPRLVLRIALLVAAVLAAAPLLAARNGRQVYSQQCAACHGTHGQGTANYTHPLVGDLPVAELADLIERTMPEGNPEACVGAEASAAARYLYDAFYSPQAQARLNPPRVELSHLTARQHQQTLLDLAQSFTWRGRQDDSRGLVFELFRSHSLDNQHRVQEKTVPSVDFSLVESGLVERDYLFPAKEDEPKDVMDRAKGKSVVMLWHGGLRAPESGVYELVVQTNAGFQLWLNARQPVVDARVRSPEDGLGRVRIKLVEGRVYPLRLEVKRVYEDDVTVRLAWRRPYGAEQPIPSHVLSPHPQPYQMVIQRDLPPDDSSLGFERGVDLSEAWDDATTDAALQAATRLVEELPRLLKLPDDRMHARNTVNNFCLDFADRAFRYPLADAERERYVDRWFAGDAPWEQAALLSLIATLKSPRFLYPEAGWADAPRDWRVAGRLSLAMWDSIPDKPLTQQATRGKLANRAEAARQAHWMLDDPRTRAKLLAFLRHWLQVDQHEPLRRDPEVFEGFDGQVAADLRTSLELFLDEALAGGHADFRRLFLAEETYLNARLAEFLGAPPVREVGFQSIRFESSVRAGFVTHPYVVATHAYYRDTSPIHRGVFLARRVLGRALAPPPEAVAPEPPEHHPGLTTRERVDLQTRPNACQHCHVLINNLGFSLENFDAVGRFRERT